MIAACLENLRSDGLDLLLVLHVPDDPVDPAGDELHVVFAEAAGGGRRSADPDAARDEGTLGVKGNGVLVHRDPRPVEGCFRCLSRHALGREVHENQVVVRSPGDKMIVEGQEFPGEGFRVGHHLFLVFPEGRLQGLPEGHGLRRDNVHERAALHAGEDVLVDDLGIFGGGHDHAAPGTPEGLVGG
ncbi:hypothetical protein SDC9_49743 [bioreactor metagenome]|uniref:Uncharacterized protein n=1 Tax=bioreactor metagenome TaxID=1076179 RepID=A0A644WHX4_9ZZZZ